MKNRILAFGNDSVYSQTNKKMAQMVAIGGVALASAFALFVNILWSDKVDLLLVNSLPFAYLLLWFISFSKKLTAKKLYNILLVSFILSTYLVIYVGYQLNYNAQFDILFVAIVNIMLLVLASRRQLRIYFISVFVPAVLFLFLSDADKVTAAILVVMFAFGATLSFIITSQRNNLYKRLKSNDNILKALIQSTNESIILVNYYSKKIVDVNEKALKEFGYQNADELLGENYTETLFANYADLQNQRMEIKRQLNTRGFFETEIKLNRKDGTKFWALLTIIPFEAENENFYLLQIRNIDDKKQIEQQLLEKNFWFDFIMNNIDEFIYVTRYFKDGTKKIEYASPFIQQIFGLSKDEYLSEETRAILIQRYHPEDLEKAKKKVEQFRVEKKPIENIYRFKPVGSDEYIWIQEKVIPKLDEEGNIEYTLGVLRKIDPIEEN
jgi:PAS domain S-box-containing protein